jgi:catalase (peroxidase I)
MTPQDMAIRWDPEMKAIAQEYARDHDRHLKDLISAWTRIMNSDRFSGPGTSPCPVYIET